MMCERPCYYLVGSTGFPNFGDELVAATWLRHLAEVAPHADVWVDSQEAGSAQLLLGHLHPRVRFVDTLWRLCQDAPSQEPWQVASWVQRAVQDPGLAPRWVAGIELLARADVVHLIGGGYVTALWPERIGLLAGAAAAVRRSGGRAVVTGQCFYPAVRGCEPLLRALLERFDVVDVRDTPSAELAGDGSAVTQTCDDVFLRLGAGAHDLIDATTPAPDYMVCVQSDAGQVSTPGLAALVLETLQSWGARPEQVGVVEGIPGMDREVYTLLEQELPGAQFHPFSELWASGTPIATHQRWISSRFHFHLLAAAAGATGLALSVHPEYYTTKHRSLIELGSGWQLLDLDRRTPEPADPVPGGFPASVRQRCAAQKLDLAHRIYPSSPPPAAEPPAAESTTDEPATEEFPDGVRHHAHSAASGPGPGAARNPRALWARLRRTDARPPSTGRRPG
jgi:polysaccharide pyruvyl transferase WcaK-like protein